MKIGKQEFFAHFHDQISQDLCDYVTNTALLSSRYLFVERVGKDQLGYCTHCRKYHTTGTGKVYLKHGETWKCPTCESEVIVKSSGRSRTKLVDEAFVVWYEKSIANSKAIVARGIFVRRDYTGDYTKTETEQSVFSMYLFVPGMPGMQYRFSYGYRPGWVQSDSVVSEFGSFNTGFRRLVATESIEKAVQGTPYQYSQWNEFLEESRDLVKFFDLASKYPCVEYLAKLGLKGFVDAKLTGKKTYSAVNWKGKTIETVLKLSRSEYRDLRSVQGKVGPETLHSYRICTKEGMRVNFEQAYMLQSALCNDRFWKLSKRAPFEKIVRYFIKQYRKESGRYQSTDDVRRDWDDYLEQCETLGMDLTQQHVMFPNNLYIAHEKTTEKVMIKNDESINILIAERLPSLVKKYIFQKDGFLIRPARDSIELFKEGKALSHCVGMYSKRYAEGVTDIVLLRKVDDPETPFYTLEISDRRIVQVEGYKRARPTPEVQAFIDAFKTKKKIYTNRPGKPLVEVLRGVELEVAV